MIDERMIVSAVRWPFTVTPSEPVVGEAVLCGDHVMAHPQLGGHQLIQEAIVLQDIFVGSLACAVCNVELLENGHGINPLGLLHHTQKAPLARGRNKKK